MPIDASIPLQARGPEMMTPQQAVSLQNLARQGQMQQIQMQEQQRERENRNAMLEIVRDPSSRDPVTGTFSQSAMQKIYGINPQMGMQIEQNRSVRLRELGALAEKQYGAVQDIDQAGAVAYAQAKGKMSDEEARRAATEAMQFKADELEKSGLRSAWGFDDAKWQGIRSRPFNPAMGAGLVTLKDVAAAEQPKSDIGKVEADYRAGRISKADRDAAIKKKEGLTVNIGDDQTIPPETLRFMAKQALTGDTSVFQNIGRGKQGAKNIGLLRQEMMTLAKEMNIPPEELAARNAEFFGIKAGERALGTRTANIEMAVNEADQFADLALKASQGFKRTGYTPLNKALAAFEKGTGGEEISRFVAANNSFINAYARAISPSGVPTVNDKEHAREMINTAQTEKQYAAVIDQLKKEMAAAVRAPGIVRGSFREAVTKGGRDVQGPKVGDEQEGYKFKGGNPADPKAWEKL